MKSINGISFFSIALFFSTMSFAATTTLVGVTGVSRSEGIGTSSQIIYGGMAGDYNNSTCTQDDISTCDTCKLVAGLESCSFESVRPTQVITFTLKSDTPTGTFKIKHNSDDVTLATTPTGVTANNEYTASVTWGAICERMGSDSNCTSLTSWNGTITIGWDNNGDGTIDGGASVQIYFRYLAAGASTYTDCETVSSTSGQGFCHFKALRGDQKVFVSDLTVDGQFPASSTSSINYLNAVLFFAPVAAGSSEAATIAALTPTADSFELTVQTSQDPPVSDNRVTELSNGVDYCFLLANKDVTGIVSFMTPATVTTNRCAKPDEVKGLLDGKGCFIATAAYGSDMAPEVSQFRKFRSEVLVHSKIGREFVRLYYQYSPYWADRIKESESAKAVVRGALWPLLAIVNFILAVGFKTFLGVVLGLGGLLVSFMRLRRKREV